MTPIICKFWPLDVQRAATALRPTLLHPVDREPNIEIGSSLFER